MNRDISLSEFEYTLRTNLTSSFILTKCVVDGMKAKNWGRIIYISSIAAYGAGLNGCHYAASKGGLTAMMKNLSQKLAPYGITANDVAPAMIQETGMIPGASAFPGLQDSIPVGRLGYVEEVGNVVSMFCRTGYMTGQSVLLGGGLKIVG
jgi:3-oxoacyl-[acyl-carrier protein] reductase